MQIEKKVIARLDQCYSLGRLTYGGRPCFLVAAEKDDPCLLFSEEGELLDTVWQAPGGTMTVASLPGREGAFLATRKFYSPDDSKEASIILAQPGAQGGWEIRKLCDAPFVHRFGILERGGVRYLIVCCLKSGHEHEGDWRFPGACYGAVLPDDLSAYDEDHQLPLTLLKDGLLKNHGFSIFRDGEGESAIVGCEAGTLRFTPPAAPGGEWEIRQLLAVPTSDAVLMDFDGDGQPELGLISPFHGSSLTVWHLDGDGNYVPQWKCPLPEKDTEMLHATWACTLLGKPTWLVGWRKGTRDTVAVTWDPEAGDYVTAVIDRDVGCANIMHFTDQTGSDVVVAANRETDEVALYRITK